MSAQLTKRAAAGPDVELISVTLLLTRFRMKLETEAGGPVHELQVNAACLLSDLAAYLELSLENHDCILGPAAAEFVARLMDSQMTPTVRH